MKTYVPVGNFERQTTFCALLVAELVVRELEVYLQESLPPAFAEQIAARAEKIAVARPKEVRERFRNWHCLKAFMRHWLAAALVVEKPAVFRRLPEGFCIGHPAPIASAAPVIKRSKQVRRSRRCPTRSNVFVHGIELLQS